MNDVKLNRIYFVGIWLVMLAFNVVFPASSDDVAHYFMAIDENASFFNSYLNWNGRLGELLWSGYLARFAFSFWFDLFNALIGAVFIFVFFALVFARLPKGKLDHLTLALMCLMFVNVNFAAIFMWGAGSANYLWGIGLIVLFLIPYRLMWGKVLCEGEQLFWNLNLAEVSLAFALLLFGVFAGWASEHIGALVSFGLGLSFVLAIFRGVKLPLWYFLGALGFWCGWMILFNSPGSASRAALFVPNGGFLTIGMIWEMNLWEKAKLINQVFCRYYSSGFAYFLVIFLGFYAYKMQIRLKWYQWILCVFGIVLSCVFAKHISGLVIYMGVLYLMWKMVAKLGRDYAIYMVLFGVWAFIALILIQLKGSLPWRGRFGNELLLMAMVALMFRDMYMQSAFKAWIEKILYGALAVSVILCFANWAYVGYNWIQVEKIIAEQKSRGNNEIVVSKKYFKSFYAPNWDMPSDDPQWWVNGVYAKYFGIKSFVVQ